MLLSDLESLRNAYPLFRNLGDPSIDWERWRALIVTPVGDRAMRLSQTYESNWHETPCIKTVDLSCTHAADLPAGVLLCPECPRECVRVFTSEKARQAHRSRAHGHRAVAVPCTTMLTKNAGWPVTQTLSSGDCSRGRTRSGCWSDEVHESSFPNLTPHFGMPRKMTSPSFVLSGCLTGMNTLNSWSVLHAILVASCRTTPVALLVAVGFGLNGFASKSSTHRRAIF